ncbi:Protein of unknown function DUF1677 [Macleaya cordata]|uniref:DUF1677 domain-containing protein n=1 Tax=Macleaya cordata TaxID=56857 RepID=A0A200PT48_MACCD|nr:Protein of unknown function DUF1677 [Macleaya cordata]
MAISDPDSQSTTIKINSVPNEVEFVKCDCCGIKEECTPAYIDRIRERYEGKWVCGLCSEAIEDEIIRSDKLITIEEALNRHMNFYKKFSCSPPTSPNVDLIIAIRQLFRKSLDSPRVLRSTLSSPLRKNDDVRHPSLARSESCFPTLAG